MSGDLGTLAKLAVPASVLLGLDPEPVVSAANGGPQTPVDAGGRPATKLGYNMDCAGVLGRALLGPRQLGIDVLFRMKNRPEPDHDEIRFWVGQMLKLAPALGSMSFDWITSAPSSNARPWHLATIMGHVAAELAGVPYADLFSNEIPRGHKSVLAEKLREARRFQYRLTPANRWILVIDDAVYTRKTAEAMILAAAGERVRFLWFYVA